MTLLHVANGTSTTSTIAASGIPGVRSIWADPLYEGPVPGGLSDDELVNVRARFLSEPAETTTWAGPNPAQDPVNDLRAWRASIERHDAYDEVVLWFEHDLFDQLNLIQLLAWMHDRRLPAATRTSLICVGGFPGRPDFKGLGQLTPQELASLLDTRQPITAPQYALARRAWQAFRQATPEATDQLRRDDTSALPFLAAALARFLQEYPWTRDGLSRTERRLLTVATDGDVALSRAFPRMHEGEQVYYVTDGSLAAMADSLSRTSPALLSLEDSSPTGGSPLRGTVALTAAGRSVLAGQADRVTECGIDRWLGGVHVHGRGPVWRWDDATDRVVHA